MPKSTKTNTRTSTPSAEMPGFSTTATASSGVPMNDEPLTPVSRDTSEPALNDPLQPAPDTVEAETTDGPEGPNSPANLPSSVGEGSESSVTTNKGHKLI